MELRPYQKEFTDNLARKLFEGKRKIIAQLATGGGKTICFSSISKRFTEKSGKQVLILVHRKELMMQTQRTLINAFQLDCQIIVAGMKVIPDADVFVGMVETVKRRIPLLEEKNIGLVIIDEAHIANFNKIHEHFPDCYFIGFTATPLAAAKDKPLKTFYEDIVCGIDIPELIKMGSLAVNETYAAADAVDRKQLKVVGGEFDMKSMAIMFSRPNFISGVVEIYKQKADGTKAIVFNTNIEHSLMVQNAFIMAGYKCKHIDGETEQNERELILAWFEMTDGAILCNVGIATTGFDEPSIQTVIVNRATMSMPLWLQMTGRGSRVVENKSYFTILDMGGNAITHGDWSDDRDWNDIFWNPPKKGNGIAPTKICPRCQRALHTKIMLCPECGHEFERKEIEESILPEFVLFTKNLDIIELIKQNRGKEYRPFFQIGEILAKEARKETKDMNEEKFNFILQVCYEKTAEWCHNFKGKKKRFDSWHKERAKENLINHLQNNFPKWIPTAQ